METLSGRSESGLARIIHERYSRVAGGAWRRAQSPGSGSVTHSPERSSASCGRDEGVHFARPRGGCTLRHPPGRAITVRE